MKYAKPILITLFASFPVGLLVFAAPDGLFKRDSAAQRAVQNEPLRTDELQRAIVRQLDTMRELDVSLLKAQGEVLKIQDVRTRRVEELELLKKELESLITELRRDPLELKTAAEQIIQSKSR